MRVTTQRVTALASALFVCALPAIMLLTATPAPPCQYVDSAVTADAEWSALQDQGWVGDPTDGTERLYSPECDR